MILKYHRKNMKDKILYLILGILIGAVLTAGCFLVFSKNSVPTRGGRPDMEMMENGEFERPDRNGNFVRDENFDTNTIPKDLPQTDSTNSTAE